MAIRSDRINLTEQQVSTHRKPYHTPRLEDYGEVRELTQSSQTGSYIDGGNYPFAYTSVAN